MSTEAAVHDSHDADEHDHGLSDWGYIKIAIVLGVLTAIEVATYFWDFGALEVPSLIVLMVLKFLIVVAYFMHLKFDSPLYTRMFAVGMLLALGVFAAVFTSMVFWNDPGGCKVSDFAELCDHGG